MRVKNFSLGALVVTLLGLGTVHGQTGTFYGGPESRQVPYGLGSPKMTPETALEGTGPGTDDLRAPVGLSRWMVGPERPGCCGPQNGGEIQSEIYARSGVVKAFGNGQLAQSLDTGWEIQGGVRVLFFNDCGRSAWTVDASVSNMFNNGSNAPVPFTFFGNGSAPGATTGATTVPTATTTATGITTTTSATFFPSASGGTGTFAADASVRSLNRTYLNLALGREFWLRGAALRNDDSIRWRAGFDVGGRWGQEKVHYNQPFLQHSTDLGYGTFVSVHSDIEIPFGGFDLYLGTRVEYDYTWSEVIGGNNDGDIQDINLLVSVGVRF